MLAAQPRAYVAFKWSKSFIIAKTKIYDSHRKEYFWRSLIASESYIIYHISLSSDQQGQEPFLLHWGTFGGMMTPNVPIVSEPERTTNKNPILLSKLTNRLLRMAMEHFLLRIIQDRMSVIMLENVMWYLQKVTFLFRTSKIAIFQVEVQLVNFFPRLKSILLVHKIAWKWHGCNSTPYFVSRESLLAYFHSAICQEVTVQV